MQCYRILQRFEECDFRVNKNYCTVRIGKKEETSFDKFRLVPTPFFKLLLSSIVNLEEQSGNNKYRERVNYPGQNNSRLVGYGDNLNLVGTNKYIYIYIKQRKTTYHDLF